jgi:hypothetical protein
MATEQDLTVFARLRLAPFIKEAIQAAVVARPSDTVDFVIEYLTKNRDNLKRGLITEAINYVKAGGKMENGADEELLKQYDNIKVSDMSAALLFIRYLALTLLPTEKA